MILHDFFFFKQHPAYEISPALAGSEMCLRDSFHLSCPQKFQGCFIEVFDYSGHSVAKYELDVLLYAFDVDEENGIIYGYNSDVFEDGFLKYTIL